MKTTQHSESSISISSNCSIHSLFLISILLILVGCRSDPFRAHLASDYQLRVTDIGLCEGFDDEHFQPIGKKTSLVLTANTKEVIAYYLLEDPLVQDDRTDAPMPSFRWVRDGKQVYRESLPIPTGKYWYYILSVQNDEKVLPPGKYQFQVLDGWYGVHILRSLDFEIAAP